MLHLKSFFMLLNDWITLLDMYDILKDKSVNALNVSQTQRIPCAYICIHVFFIHSFSVAAYHVSRAAGIIGRAANFA